jgi:hypothetical protein
MQLSVDVNMIKVLNKYGNIHKNTYMGAHLDDALRSTLKFEEIEL